MAHPQEKIFYTYSFNSKCIEEIYELKRIKSTMETLTKAIEYSIIDNCNVDLIVFDKKYKPILLYIQSERKYINATTRAYIDKVMSYRVF